jgi:DNA-binding PadR family transcriptional regulator
VPCGSIQWSRCANRRADGSRLDPCSHCGYNPRVSPEPRADEFLPLPPATLHILLALAESERHGYAIIQDVEARTDGELRMSAGTLYRSIARMVEQGLIVEVEKRRSRADDERRRYYRLTPLGESVARAEVQRLSQLVRHARARGLAPRTV